MSKSLVQGALSISFFSSYCSLNFNSNGMVDNLNGSWLELKETRFQRGYRSSSNSNSSSISSSSTSSDSDDKMIPGAGDLDADADSLSCGQSDLSSVDQLNNDDLRLVDIYLHTYFSF